MCAEGSNDGDGGAARQRGARERAPTRNLAGACGLAGVLPFCFLPSAPGHDR